MTQMVSFYQKTIPELKPNMLISTLASGISQNELRQRLLMKLENAIKQ